MFHPCYDDVYLVSPCPQKEFGTARYDSICSGCPSWEDCQNCTVGELASAPICSTALEHTTTNGSGSTLETLSVDEGYWRATSDSNTILPCYNVKACAGGQTGTETFCNDGYSGACERNATVGVAPYGLRFSYEELSISPEPGTSKKPTRTTRPTVFSASLTVY